SSSGSSCIARRGCSRAGQSPRFRIMGRSTRQAYSRLNTRMDFLISREDLHETRFDESPAPAPSDGEAVLTVESFGLTSNNITYAAFGEAMSYWKFFPAPDGWGRMPVWGFATVAESRVEGLAEG